MWSSNFVSHFRNAFPSFRRVSLSFSPIAQKNWFRTLGVLQLEPGLCLLLHGP